LICETRKILQPTTREDIMDGQPGYRRAVLRTLFPGNHHPLLHTDPPDYTGNLMDEWRRAQLNAALIVSRLRKIPDNDPARAALNDAMTGEHGIANACEYLENMRGARATAVN
jgi:hypothetical protein